MKRWIRSTVMVLALGVGVLVAVDLFRSVAPKERHNFVLRDLKGKSWSLAEHRGRGPVLISFFATWCAPCRMEFPQYLSYQKMYAASGLRVVFITDEPRETILREPDLARAPATILIDGKPVFEEYNVTGLPKTVLFRPDGDLELELDGFGEGPMKQVKAALENYMPPDPNPGRQ